MPGTWVPHAPHPTLVTGRQMTDNGELITMCQPANGDNTKLEVKMVHVTDIPECNNK